MNEWSETRKLGMWKYILFYGIILGGMGIALVEAGIDLYFHGGLNHFTDYTTTGLIFGTTYGTGTWFHGEYKFRKVTKKTP
ncbi:hypothetical protein [Alkalihalobacillus sp. CinArs1]|uniref:hypothetical protein n=1 Tax=Alkalihalobacillus sp. CinArs1 TaxID=2995314 RepID=UPI0022DCE6DE|nr:hypothetical protein [Alkalihalobacillus sp. CinArs1]